MMDKTTSTEGYSMTHRPKLIMHWGQKCILNGPPQNHSPELPPFHIKHNCCFLPSLWEFIVQIQAKKSFCPGLLKTLFTFACPHKQQLLPTPSSLIHCSSVPEPSPITISNSAFWERQPWINTDYWASASFPEWISCCNTQGLQTSFSVNSSSLVTELSRE